MTLDFVHAYSITQSSMVLRFFLSPSLASFCGEDAKHQTFKIFAGFHAFLTGILTLKGGHFLAEENILQRLLKMFANCFKHRMELHLCSFYRKCAR